MINKNNHLGKIYISALLGALGIVLGAFSAHGLEKLVENQIITLHHLNVFEKAVKYQMYHSIVLLVLSISNFIFQKNVFQKSYWMILLDSIAKPYTHCFSKVFVLDNTIRRAFDDNWMDFYNY
mgnify:CR=1 FL=1